MSFQQHQQQLVNPPKSLPPNNATSTLPANFLPPSMSQHFPMGPASNSQPQPPSSTQLNHLPPPLQQSHLPPQQQKYLPPSLQRPPSGQQFQLSNQPPLQQQQQQQPPPPSGNNHLLTNGSSSLTTSRSNTPTQNLKQQQPAATSQQHRYRPPTEAIVPSTNNFPNSEQNNKPPSSVVQSQLINQMGNMQVNNNNSVHLPPPPSSMGPPPLSYMRPVGPPQSLQPQPPPLAANVQKRPHYPDSHGTQQQQPLLQQQYQQQQPPQQPYQQQGYNGHQQQQQLPPTVNVVGQQQQLPPTANVVGQQQQQQQQPLQYQSQFASFGSQPQAQQHGGLVQQGFNKLWGQETIDLMQYRHVLPPTRVQPPPVELGHEFYESVNCSPDILRCTLTKIPDTSGLLQKSRLPLGILIHPFRDLNNLPVIQCSAIVRCRSCRTYINPFVTFVDSKKWRCNLCYRVNELPDEFQYDPVSKSYGDVTRRPEVKSSTIEFIAPSEYMLRPPQPAIYLFLLDVSQIAQQSGYLEIVCATLSEHLDGLPGDVRTKVGFLAYNSAVHFYHIADGFNQPHEITVVDIDEPFLPCPDNLLINLKECKELIKDLLVQLPTRFANSYDSNSALGTALQIAYKLMHQSGGRVTVFQTCLPNVGPGSLKARENPNDRSAKEIQHLGPATDFYKRLALDCSGQQIAVDLFLMNSQYSDLATLSGMSKFSGGCMHHFPLFNKTKLLQVDLFKKTLERYITRKIGFESVMRIRCTRGLAIHTFHGNFFVRSTDLLSLPNVNPDAGFGMQISYEESLSDTKTVCFQAALLYTSSKGERRIRVHTLCLPVTSSLSDVMYSADGQAIIGLISKMAVDRSLQSSLTDARDAFINASVDVFSAFRVAQNMPSGGGQLIAPKNLALLPLYMMALLKHVAFRTGTSTRLDDRLFAMCELKTLPLDQLIKNIYPDFYQLDELFYNAAMGRDNEENKYEPPLLQLSAEKLDSRSVFMLDTGSCILLLVGTNVSPQILQNVFAVTAINEIADLTIELPNTGKPESEALNAFIDAISVDKPFAATIQIIRDSSPYRITFTEKLVDDRSESSLSYYEFLQHLRTQVK